ncbi:MAG: sel1 repeat family protein [Lentisphaeraceae bacterium]|nr:sel1 repeat family protein [Lentisphaeraceae bacterium]
MKKLLFQTVLLLIAATSCRTSLSLLQDAKMRAEAGDSRYYNNYAEYLQYGLSQDKTKFTEVMKYFTKAAELNNTAAMISLGDLYHKGEYLEKDNNKATHWYQKAADLGNPRGYSQMAVMLMSTKIKKPQASMSHSDYLENSKISNKILNLFDKAKDLRKAQAAAPKSYSLEEQFKQCSNKTSDIFLDENFNSSNGTFSAHSKSSILVPAKTITHKRKDSKSKHHLHTALYGYLKDDSDFHSGINNNTLQQKNSLSNFLSSTTSIQQAGSSKIYIEQANGIFQSFLVDKLKVTTLPVDTEKDYPFSSFSHIKHLMGFVSDDLSSLSINQNDLGEKVSSSFTKKSSLLRLNTKENSYEKNDAKQLFSSSDSSTLLAGFLHSQSSFSNLINNKISFSSKEVNYFSNCGVSHFKTVSNSAPIKTNSDTYQIGAGALWSQSRKKAYDLEDEYVERYEKKMLFSMLYSSSITHSSNKFDKEKNYSCLLGLFGYNKDYYGEYITFLWVPIKL